MKVDINLFRSIPIFQGLTKEELEFIADIAIEKKVGKDAVVVHQGDIGEALYIIVKGEVKVCMISEDGKEIILDYLRKGDFFGEMALFGDRVRSARVESVRNTELLIVEQREFLTIVHKKPLILITILKEMSRRLREADRKISSLAFLDVSGRIAHFLLELMKKQGKKTPKGIFVEKRPTVQEMAQVVGASRETVSRTLTSFKNRGIIEMTREGILIRNIALQ